MDLHLSGKTALVTGASQGIGRASAKALAAEGVQTAIAARREDLLTDLADEVTAADHPRPIVIPHDIMAQDGPESLGARAMDALGHVDILIKLYFECHFNLEIPRFSHNANGGRPRVNQDF